MKAVHSPLHARHEGGMELYRGQLVPTFETPGRVDMILAALESAHFEITAPQVDLAVETARAAGALGARMTGGGFGGCIIALVPAGEAERVGGEIVHSFAAAEFGQPMYFTAVPSAGARRLQ